MVDREIIAARLSKLREALRKLRGIAAGSHEEYMRSETDQALAEHFLRLALECALDIGNHVISDEGFKKPLQLRDIPQILADHDVISRELADKLSLASGLRNRLVHVYTDIDHEMIYAVLQEGLDDLERFAVAVGAFCGG